MITCRLVGQAALVGVLLVLTRHLSRADFGMFMTALAIQGYVLLVGSAGLPAVVVREMVRRPQDQRRIASTYLSMTGVMGFGAWTVLSVIVIFLPLGPSEKSLLILTSLAAAIASINPEPLFDSQHAQATASMLVVLGDLLLPAAILLLIATNRLTLASIAICLVFKWLLVVLLLGSNKKVRHLLSSRFVSLQEARCLWRSSCHLLIASALAMVPVSGPTIVARVFSGPQEAAIVGLAVQVLQAYIMIVALMQRLLRPHVAGPYGFDRKFVVKLVLFNVAVLSTLFVCAVMGSYVVVRWILPTEYGAALVPCVIMAGAGFIGGCGSAVTTYLLVMGRERSILLSFVAAGATFTLAAAFSLTNSSAVGLAMGTVLAYTALLSVSTLQLYRVVRRPGTARV
jgi:O-antigen/teichoic acid export membrane protein